MSTNNLNERQKIAVETTDGPLLVLAGAGAGKTKTIAHRIQNLVHKGIAPRAILAITFTNKASKEMRERVDLLLSSDNSFNRPISNFERPFVSTFHSLGVHIIKEQCHLLGVTRNFTIFDRADSKRAVKEGLEKVGLDPKEFEPGKILSAISREKGDGVTQKVYSEKANDFFSKMVAKVWEHYDIILRKEKSFDFDDLLLVTSQLLTKNEEVRKHYSLVWKYVHIDEYQDTNRTQYLIAEALTRDNRNICVVGDIDQNIYSWRGADIQNILNFEKDYPEAKIVLLEENYRSTKTILAAANKVIEKNSMRRKKTLFTNNDAGEKISLITSYTEDEEATMIAEKAKELIAEGVDPREISVLYRANFQSRVLEEAFLRKSVPYQILGTRFFDRKEVKDILSFIRASLNQEGTSDLVRIINVPPRGIGKATLIKVVAGNEATLPAGMQQKVAQFKALLERIREAAASLSPSELVKYVIRESGIERALREGTSEDQEKLENVREMVSLASKYDTMPLGEGIEALITEAALASDQDELEKDHRAVKLMTVHASKGLEYDFVFIAGLEEDLFPHARLGEEHVSEAHSEEERRLFYVALTRARKKIFLSHSQLRTIYGTQKVNTPSQFIEDIGDEFIEQEERQEVRGVKAIFIDF